MKTVYSRDADVLATQLSEGQPFDSADMAEGVIVHLSEKGRPLGIEILGASEIIDNKQVEISLEALFSTTSQQFGRKHQERRQ